MGKDRFLGYLEYRYCVEEEIHRKYSIYKCTENNQIPSVSTDNEYIHAYQVILACMALQIPPPDGVEFTQYSSQT